jgi:hypothetical protein
MMVLKTSIEFEGNFSSHVQMMVLGGATSTCSCGLVESSSLDCSVVLSWQISMCYLILFWHARSLGVMFKV